jgi:hypothetical protein
VYQHPMHTYQDFTKKRRVEDVEKVDDVEKFVNLFTKRLHIDDV